MSSIIISIHTPNRMNNFLNKTHLFNCSFLASVLLGLTLALCGCNSNNGINPKINEGTINYEISYPGRPEGGILDGVLPRVMKMEFQESRYVNTIAAAGIFESKLITNCEDKTVTFTFNFGPEKIYSIIPESVADSLLYAQFDIPELVNVRGLEQVAGYSCDRTFAIFDQLEDGPDFEVKFTSDIGIKNPNWCNQFKELEAVMLEYEVRQYGLRLKMTATDINSDPIDIHVFDVADDFKEVSVAEIIYQFEEVFKNFQ